MGTATLPGMPLPTRVRIGAKDSSVRQLREVVLPDETRAEQYRHRVLNEGQSVVEAYIGFILPLLPMIWVVRVTNVGGELVESVPWRNPNY